MSGSIDVYVEVAPKRTYASALDWPGWSRGGRMEEDALSALVAYADRYATVAKRASVAFDPPNGLAGLQVVERLTGGASTEFGIPSLPAAADERPLKGPELGRQRRLFEASWKQFDAIAKGAVGVELRKGPRGGGRDLEKIRDHVFQAERSYLTQLGARFGGSEAVEEWPKLRRAIMEALEARAAGAPVAEPSGTKKRWSPRYFLRRAAWHVLDHAWEIEDRARP